MAGAKRPIVNVNGWVHDIDKVSSLSSAQFNLRLLSDKTLYILQGLSGEDVTFLSRYGTILDDGYYLPVLSGSADASVVEDAINTIRKDLNDMTIEDTLACICAKMSDIAVAITASAASSCGCEIGTDVDTDSGQEGGGLPGAVNGVPYTQPSAIEDRKCKAANYIHGGIKDVVNELYLNRVDSYSFAGLATVLSIVSSIVGFLVAGPFGLLVGAVAGSLLSAATLLFKASFNLGLLNTALGADDQLAVCALYEATTADEAREAYVAYAEDSGATTTETAFLRLLLPNSLLNLLFFGWGDSEDAIGSATILASCTSCVGIIEQWTFPTDDEGWTWVDTSTQPQGSSSMEWYAANQSLRAHMLLNGGAYTQTEGSYISPAVSIQSDGSQRVDFYLSGPSDGIVMTNILTVKFASSPDEIFVYGALTGPATRQSVVTTVDEIVGIEILIGRYTGPGSGNYDFYNELDDVVIRNI